MYYIVKNNKCNSKMFMVSLKFLVNNDQDFWN